MHDWHGFAAADPALGAFGEARINTAAPSFLATVRDGALPRVHPVGARVKGGHLALYMYDTSPKARDLDNDGRYALHCSVADNDGGDGEFQVRGYGVRVSTDVHKAALAAAGFIEREGYILYELGVSDAFACVYGDDGSAKIQRWRQSS